MLSWWLSLEPGDKLLYEWLLGVVVATGWIVGYVIRDYYKRYTAYLNGKEYDEPEFFINHADGRNLDGEQKGLIVLLGLIIIAVWPGSLALFLCYKLSKLRLFTEILNPAFWTRQWAIRKNKVAVVTSPNQKIRALVGRKAKDD